MNKHKALTGQTFFQTLSKQFFPNLTPCQK